MERAEFIVEADGWKTFYRMRYDGKREKLLAFSSLVEGTTHKKVGDLFPELKPSVDVRAFESLAKEVSKLAKKVVKGAGVSKDYSKFAEMWAAREILAAAGLKLVPESRDLKKILKKI